ncbi:RMD1 family protein [Bradyrhizobium sp.]|uniref:RMD1 family protein n=1 Tax=Bradyrhizobium sp. TaxID=376 RepID=UPI001DB89ED9|nr:RMD1 family protein [Bradyrhizobium sp.]MBI5322261.1 RMD1 family protein [Bradyrhizobium sp.]
MESNATQAETADRSILPAAYAAPGQRVPARALRLGGRFRLTGIETGDFDQAETLGTAPLQLRLRSGGFAALFPYGTVVVIGVSPAAEEALLHRLADRVEGRLGAPAVVATEIEIGTGAKISGDVITVRDLSASSLYIVADALAKNAALAFEEEEVRRVLEVLEPFASDLADTGRLPRNRRRMLRTVGHALRTHHRLIERVEVEDRPELLDDGDADRLHDVLAHAWHFKKRAKALSRRLSVIEVMTSALTELIDAQREIRLEALIVLLIALEMSVYFYELFIRGG